MARKTGFRSGTIAFAAGSYGEYDLWAVKANGRKAVRLVHNSAWNDYPRWSPDGNELLFSSNLHGTFGIYKLNLKDRDLQPVHVSHVWDGTANWSPDGRSIVFSSRRAGPCNIWHMKLEGERLTQITFDDFVDYSPAFSPDGSRILFISNRSGTEELWMLEYPSLRSERLTELHRRIFSPTWSPDGTRIAFITWEETEGYRIFDLEWQSRTIRPVSSTPGEKRSLCWSPDGSAVLYSGVADGTSFFDLRLRMLEDGREHALMEKPLLPFSSIQRLGERDKHNPSWSPVQVPL